MKVRARAGGVGRGGILGTLSLTKIFTCARAARTHLRLHRLSRSPRLFSEQAAEKMVLAERTSKRITATRVEYAPVPVAQRAQRAAKLYFTIAALSARG